jgi:MYXO-CTERM domain-containing protein
MKRARIDWFVVVLCLFFAVSCSGGGCGGCAGMEPIPGGFPAGKRHPNGGQVRVTRSALDTVQNNVASIVGPLLGNSANGVVKFSLPPSCGGSTPICCPGGTATTNCGPIDIDLNGTNRLALTPQAVNASNGQLNVTLHAKVKTEQNLIITVAGTDCDIHLDTTAGSTPDMTVTTQVALTQDATSGTTFIKAQNTAVTLESADYSITPHTSSDFLCYGSAFIPTSVIEGQLATQVENQINGQTCKACPSGNVAECGSPFATACTSGVCQEGNQCLQELGLTGRMKGSALFASLSPGTTGALDLYEVAGGYSTTANNGVALGLLGGMEPGGTARDRCGPMATEPTTGNIPQSAFFQGNTRPDNNQAFDVAIGLHKSQLTQFAYAGYDGGLLCLTIGHSFASQLSTDTLSLLSRSLGKLVETNSPMAVGLRPQSPPTITLGKNTFTTDGAGNTTLTEPLLDIKFQAMEIDFFAEVDQQWIRVFTVVSDVHLPLGLQVGAMGTITPVLGDTMDAFTNLSVKNSEAVTETPDQLAMLFPNLLSIVLPQLSSGLPAINLPAIGGLNLSVTDITSVDDKDGDGQPDFLAIFANLAVASAARPVTTTATVADVQDAKGLAPRTITLELGGGARDLEFSYRLDDTTWTAWGTNRHPVIKAHLLELPGVHHIDVRAREKGLPETTALVPVRLTVELGAPRVAANTGAGFHGQAGQAGCACDAGTSPGAAAPLALLVVGMLVGRRRSSRRRVRRLARSAMRLGPMVWLIALACLPGCSCSSHPCGDTSCMPGEVQRGAVGRWTSIAGDDKRVMVATYDQVLGDLVAVDVTDPMNMKFTAVDGIPTDASPTYDPSTYRGGVADAGPNVGAWTSVALSNHEGKIAYQDRDAGNLKYAFEKSEGKWDSYVVDGDATTGEYASMIVDGGGNPAIAYLAVGIDDGMGHRNTELRLARAGKADPQVMSDWTISTIATAAGTCGGLCTGGQSCVADATSGVESCVAPTTDCSAACATGDVCVNAACVTEIADPMIDDIPQGTGLFVSLVSLPDGRLAAAYYDRTRRALVLSVENAPATSQFTENILDGNVAGADRGMWSTAAVAGDGTVHLAYQDALGDQLMYTTWNGTAGVPEIVDDGTRPNDRTHPVGGGAVIYLNNGTPTIAYQDGMTADVYLAVKAGAAWMPTGLATGPLLDGFSIAVTTGHGTPVLAWDTLDPSQDPPNGLTVLSP